MRPPHDAYWHQPQPLSQLEETMGPLSLHTARWPCQAVPPAARCPLLPGLALASDAAAVPRTVPSSPLPPPPPDSGLRLTPLPPLQLSSGSQ